MRYKPSLFRQPGTRWSIGVLSLAVLAVGFSPPSLAQFDRDVYLARSQQLQNTRLARAAQARELRASELIVMNGEGSELARIGLSEANVSQWQASPDGSYIAQLRVQPSADPTMASSDLFVLDVATGESARLTVSGEGDTVIGFSWSPDSRELAYLARRESRFNIYRHALSASQADTDELLYSSPASISPGDWSPDGRYITFSSDFLTGMSEGGYIAAIDLESDENPLRFFDSDQLVVTPRYSPDGRYQIFGSTAEDGFGSYVVDLASEEGAVAEAFQLALPGTLQLMYFSQDGEDIFYCDGDEQMFTVPVNSAQGAYRFDAKDATPVATPDVISAVYPETGCYSQSREGAYLFFEVATDLPPRQLMIFDREGEEISRIGEPASWLTPSFSPDGTQVVAWDFGSGDPTAPSDFQIFDVASGESVQRWETEPLSQLPVWMPGGEHIGYSVISLGPPVYSMIYQRRTDGRRDPELLWRSEQDVVVAQLLDVTRDNSFLAIDQLAYIVSVAVAEADPLAREDVDMLRDEFDVQSAAFSPDSRQVAYLYNDTGWPELYVAPFDTATGEADMSRSVRISEGGAMGGVGWRDDGRELYFLNDRLETPELNDYRVMAAALGPSGFVEGEPKVLFEVTLPVAITNSGMVAYSRIASPDGQRFVLALDADTQ